MSKKTDKYLRLSEKLVREKQQKIKDVQDQWKSNFVDDKEVHAFGRIYKTMNYEEEELPPEYMQKKYEYEARQYKYAYFEGRKIYMAGLDIGLLKQQKMEEEKAKKLQKNYIFNKIAEKVKIVEKVNKVSHNKLYKDMVVRMFTNNTAKNPTITLNHYYYYDTDYHFGSCTPKILIRRPGKFHQHPIHPGITSDKIDYMMEMMYRNNKRRELMKIFDEAKEAHVYEHYYEESDEYITLLRSIFDTDAQVDIQIGRYLKFYKEDRVVQPKIVKADIDFTKDEYYLLKLDQVRKRRKLIDGYISRPGYEQPQDPYSYCFWNTGPTLQEERYLKARGIEVYYGDEKYFKKREKKINYNKYYEKIQRVIAEKEKK